MKIKHLIFLLLLGAGFLPALAQSDSVEVADSVVFATDGIQFCEDVPVAGSLAVNKLAGLVVSKHQLSRHFLEVALPFGYSARRDDFGRGWGLHYAYVPQRWGLFAEACYDRFYFSGADGVLYYQPSGHVAGGVVVRPVLAPSAIDWQLFAGITSGGQGLGYEAGTRFAPGAKSNTSRFSWLSGSISMMRTTQGTFVTLGLSIGASFIALIFI